MPFIILDKNKPYYLRGLRETAAWFKIESLFLKIQNRTDN